MSSDTPLPEIRGDVSRRLINSLGLALVAIFLIGLGLLVWEPMVTWTQGEEARDQALIEEWISHARIGQFTLRSLVNNYLKSRHVDPASGPGDHQLQKLRRREIQDFLKELGTPVSLTESTYLPLLPVVYRIEVQFGQHDGISPVIWDSGLPRSEGVATSRVVHLTDQCTVAVQAQLRAYQDRLRMEEEQIRRKTILGSALMGMTAIGLAWVLLTGWRIDLERRARRRSRESALLARSEELKRELDRQAEFLASLNVVAGSYAHNLQNLLLPPVGLIDECLGQIETPHPARQRLIEIRRLLGQVSDRVRQTLKALRRDPGPGTLGMIDMQSLVSRVVNTWKDLAHDKWQINITYDSQAVGTLRGDESHLEQALENLIINARDAIFEKRRVMVADASSLPPEIPLDDQRARLMASMRWFGQIDIRLNKPENGRGIKLMVADNGIGMSEEARRRCLETGFSTKKDQAIYQGTNSGMGLGLTFVAGVARHHGARLDIESNVNKGTQLTLEFAPPTDSPGADS